MRGASRLQEISHGYKQAGVLIGAIELDLFTAVSNGAQDVRIRDDLYYNASDVEKYLVQGKPRCRGPWLMAGTRYAPSAQKGSRRCHARRLVTPRCSPDNNSHSLKDSIAAVISLITLIQSIQSFFFNLLLFLKILQCLGLNLWRPLFQSIFPL